MTETIHGQVAELARGTYPEHVERDGYYKYDDFENAIEISRDGNSQWTYRHGSRATWALIATSNCLLGVELVLLMESEFATKVKQESWDSYQHEFGSAAGTELGINLDSDLMRLAAGGGRPPGQPTQG